METKNIMELIRFLKERPGMILGPHEGKKFSTYLAYIIGLSTGIKMAVGIDLYGKINRWYGTKFNNGASDASWDCLLVTRNEDKSDEELITILLDTFKNYFIENPDWSNSIEA